MPNTTDYLPTREAKLVAFANNYRNLIAADPQAYSLDQTQSDHLNDLTVAFVSAYKTAYANSSRTPTALVAKQDAKAALIAEIRTLAAIVQAAPSVSNEQVLSLGLTVRTDDMTPVAYPSAPPSITVLPSIGRSMKLRLRNIQNPDSRGKPAGVIGAIILAYRGDQPPADPLEWTFLENTTRTLVDINFPASMAAGEKVWLTAFWYNTKAQPGPPAPSISTRIADALAKAA